jgi:hypothetical protein
VVGISIKVLKEVAWQKVHLNLSKNSNHKFQRTFVCNIYHFL